MKRKRRRKKEKNPSLLHEVKRVFSFLRKLFSKESIESEALFEGMISASELEKALNETKNAQMYEKEELFSLIATVISKNRAYTNEEYASGKKMLNGHNHAKEMLYAVDYTERLLNETVEMHDVTSIEALIFLVDLHKDPFAYTYEDSEYFGVSIMNQISEMLRGS